MLTSVDSILTHADFARTAHFLQNRFRAQSKIAFALRERTEPVPSPVVREIPMADLDLTAALAQLELAATDFPSTPATFLPDFVLFSYITDVREHARAVALISNSPAPREGPLPRQRPRHDDTLCVALGCGACVMVYRSASLELGAVYRSRGPRHSRCCPRLYSREPARGFYD